MNYLKHAWYSLILFVSLLPVRNAEAQGGQTGSSFKIDNPFRAGNSLEAFIVTVINEIILPIGGVVIVLFVIYAGFQFVMAQGSPAKIDAAKKNLWWVLVGSAVLLGSWVIAQVVKNTIDNLR